MKQIYLLVIFCITWLSGNAQWYKKYITDEFTNKKEVIMVHKTDNNIDAVWYENTNELKIMFYCSPQKAFNLTFNYCWNKATEIEHTKPVIQNYNTKVLINVNGNIFEDSANIYYPVPVESTFEFWSEIYLPFVTDKTMHELKFISVRYYDKFFEETVTTKISFNGFMNKYKGMKPRKHSKKTHRK